MPTYAYACRGCRDEFDHLCTIADIDVPVPCPSCAATNDRNDRLLSARTQVYGTAVEDAVYDPVFNQVIKSSKHRRDEAKARGWVEIGNEKPETIHKIHDRQREETRAQRWRDAARDKVYAD